MTEQSQAQFAVGDRVRLAARPPYLKTADSMPMLRPPDVVDVGEEGVVLEARLVNTWAVRFDRGAFLVDSKFLEPATAAANQSSPTANPPAADEASAAADSQTTSEDEQ